MAFAGQQGDMQLGAPVAEYKAGWRFAAIIIFELISLALGVFFLLMGLVGSNGYVAPMVVFSAIGVLFIGGAGFFLWTSFKGRGARASIYQGGFTYQRAGNTVTSRWDEVASIRQSVVRTSINLIPVWTTHKYFVTLANGQAVVFDDALGNIDKLGATLQNQITKALLPRAIEAYRGGAMVPFGPVSVSQSGISVNGKTQPWNESGGVTLFSGRANFLRQGKRGAFARVPIAKVPNMFVLTGLIDFVRRGGR